MATETGHAATAAVVAVMHHALALGRWSTLRELADASGVHRDTLRRMLPELVAATWLEVELVEGVERYQPGPGLARVAYGWTQLQAERMAAAQRAYAAATAPHAWQPTPHGMRWLPLPLTSAE